MNATNVWSSLVLAAGDGYGKLSNLAFLIIGGTIKRGPNAKRMFAKRATTERDYQ